MADFGTIRGQIVLDVKQALAAYTQTRLAHLSTVTALHTGAGAMIASGAAIAGVGAVMVAGFGVAIKAAAEFERKLDFFTAVSVTTQDEYQAISDKALQLGADTIYSANQIADSFIELGKSGVSARDIIDGIGEGVAALGAAADIPLDTAANIITSAVATFQLGAGAAIDVANKLAGAANASIVEVQDLGLSLKYAGGVASALGVSFDDVNTALSIMGVNGIKGSTAGTSLRQVLLSLNGTTPKATNALRELGIITEDGSNKFFTAEGKAKSLAEVFQILQEATAGMSDQQRTATMQQIFAIRALPSLIALTRAGADGFAEMAAEIEKTTALDVASQRLDNLSGDLEILRGNIDTLMISSGSGFQQFARTVIQGVTGLIQSFLDLPTGIQTSIVGFFGIVGVLLVVIGTFGMMAGAVLNMIALFQILIPAMSALITVIKALKVVQTAATAAQWAFNIAAAANPIGLVVAIILALIAAIVLLVIYWEDVKKAFQDNPWLSIINPIIGLIANFDKVQIVFGFFMKAVVSIWDSIVTTFNQAVANVITVLGIIGDTLFKLFVQPLIDAFNFFQSLWNGLVAFTQQAILNIVAFFQSLPERIVTFFQELPGRIGYALGLVLGTIVRVVLTIGNWITTNVPIIINNIVTFFQQLPFVIGQFFIDVYNNIVSALTTAAVWLATNIPLMVNAVVTFFQELPAKVGQFFIDTYNNIVSALMMAGAWLATNIPVIIGNVLTFFAQLPAQIGAFLQQVYANVVTWFSQALATAVQIANNIFNGIRNALAGLPGLVTGIFNNVIGAIRNVIQGAFNAVRDFAAGLWEGFKDGLGIHSPSYIEEAMWAITDVVGTETNRMKDQVRTIQGLGNNISEIGNNLSFGNGLDKGLESLYNTVRAARDLEAQMAFDTSVGVEAAQMQTLAAISKTLQQLKDQPRFNVEQLTVENDGSPDIKESLPDAIRKTSYVLD